MGWLLAGLSAGLGISRPLAGLPADHDASSGSPLLSLWLLLSLLLVLTVTITLNMAITITMTIAITLTIAVTPSLPLLPYSHDYGVDA